MEHLKENIDYEVRLENTKKSSVIGDFVKRIKRMVNGILGDGMATEREKEGSKQCLKDLVNFKNSHRFKNRPSVAYIGCGNDTTVQKVFPQTINIDQIQPENWWVKNFVKGDAWNLPIESDSVDIVVEQAMSYMTEASPKSAKELSRILSKNGRIIRDFPVLKAPSELHEALCGIHYLLILKTYHENGLVFDERNSTINVTFKKGVPTLEDKQKVDEQIAEYSNDFFNYVGDIPMSDFKRMKVSPFVAGKWRYHEALEFVLGINLKSDKDAIIGQLKNLESKLNPDTYKKIQIMVNLLKRDLR